MRLQKWTLRQADKQQVLELAKKTNLPPLAVRVLVGRGFDSEQALTVFRGKAAPLGDPFLLLDMDRAVSRIRRALERKEQIVVYGDYDCDGMMATTIMCACLKSLGGRVRYFIPKRETGYGLNKDALTRLREEGASLVITVDNGIAAIDEIAAAVEMGLDVVVTDHHQPRPVLPEAAAAIIDAHRLDDNSGYEILCGTGVAFKVCCALTGKNLLEEYGDLLALATVADIVPLVGENRTYVQYGLSLMRRTKNAGLKALLAAGGFQDKPLTSEGLMFGLAPRINCAGRFDQVEDAMELLLGENADVTALAQTINRLNIKRRSVEDVMAKDISAQVHAHPDMHRQNVMVVCGQDWHHGVLGIVASRMTQQYGKPCILLSREGDTVRGSGRSVEGFSLIDALEGCSAYLQRYGGHNQAVGLTMDYGRLGEFSAAINAWAREHYPVMPVPELVLDCDVPGKALTVERFASLDCLEPFGCGHQSPLFMLKNCTLREISPVSENRHLRLRCSDGTDTFWAIYFGICREAFPFMVGDKIDLAAQIDVNEWNGEKRVSVKVKDVRSSLLDSEQVLTSLGQYRRIISGDHTEGVTVSREDVKAVYGWLRREGKVCDDPAAAVLRLSRPAQEAGKVQLCFDILQELGLAERRQASGGGLLYAIDGGKTDLSRSALWNRLQQA